MAIRKRIIWGGPESLGDPRLSGLPELVKQMRLGRRPPGVKGFGRTYKNWDGQLPPKPLGHYREYDVVPPTNSGRGILRLVLGRNGEVFITGHHYDHFHQIIKLPG